MKKYLTNLPKQIDPFQGLAFASAEWLPPTETKALPALNELF